MCKQSVQKEVSSVSERVPCEDPPFTYNQLKEAIPAHCFERSTLKSFLYLAADIFGVCFLLALAVFFDHSAIPTYFRFLLWPLYWVFQGGVMTGMWVVAHECGHRAFSSSTTVCDIVGIILHTFLLVPYHGWRISHSKHHHFTCDLGRDEVWVPPRDTDDMHESNDAHPMWALVESLGILLVGWPIYLFTHAGGRKYPTRANHFEPTSALFEDKDSLNVILSDIALVSWIGVLIYLSYTLSFITVVKYWGIPYLVVNFWLLVYTKLHHTDASLPHYDSKKWTWMRGALATVDRNYGIWNFFHHNIGDTHVVHHLFSRMPHYHAQEATDALRPLLGQYYIYDPTPWWKAGWHIVCKCRVLSEDHVNNGVYWYEQKQKKAQ